VLAVAPARYDVDHWYRWCFCLGLRWFSTGQTAQTDVIRFSRRELRRLFGRFVEHRIHKRQLRRSEIPHPSRWIPLPVLERLMGRFLVLKAFKPLSAALTVQAAA